MKPPVLALATLVASIFLATSDTFAALQPSGNSTTNQTMDDYHYDDSDDESEEDDGELRRRKAKGRNHIHKEHDYYYYEYNDLVNRRQFEILRQEGNITITSDFCRDCQSEWGGWLPWSDCNLPIPGQEEPECHNTLRTKRRYCAQKAICHEVMWEFCAHEESCRGHWSEWSEFSGNCSGRCNEEKRTRNRTCLSPMGQPISGICLGSRSDAVQQQGQECAPVECESISNTLEIALIVSGGVMLLLLLTAAVIAACRRLRKDGSQPSILSHVSSSSFLMTHWRMISQRFTRRSNGTLAEGRQEVAIAENYSAIHIYESADDYAEVSDRVEERHYEALQPQTSFDGYEIPISTGMPQQHAERPLRNEYASVDVVSPYARMQSVHAPRKVKEMKRAKSLDNALLADRSGIHRQRRMPGLAMKPPLHRGVSQLPFNVPRQFSLTSQPSMKYGPPRGAAASRIKKKLSQKQMAKSHRPNLASCSKMPHFTINSIEEDRYGYLVPNTQEAKSQNSFARTDTSWIRQNAKSFSIPKKPTAKMMKSISLPADVNFDTYVTMKPSDSAGCSSRHIV